MTTITMHKALVSYTARLRANTLSLRQPLPGASCSGESILPRACDGAAVHSQCRLQKPSPRRHLTDGDQRCAMHGAIKQRMVNLCGNKNTVLSPSWPWRR